VIANLKTVPILVLLGCAETDSGYLNVAFGTEWTSWAGLSLIGVDRKCLADGRNGAIDPERTCALGARRP
jgi:hypothetical protein